MLGFVLVVLISLPFFFLVKGVHWYVAWMVVSSILVGLVVLICIRSTRQPEEEALWDAGRTLGHRWIMTKPARFSGEPDYYYVREEEWLSLQQSMTPIVHSVTVKQNGFEMLLPGKEKGLAWLDGWMWVAISFPSFFVFLSLFSHMKPYDVISFFCAGVGGAFQWGCSVLVLMVMMLLCKVFLPRKRKTKVVVDGLFVEANGTRVLVNDVDRIKLVAGRLTLKDQESELRLTGALSAIVQLQQLLIERLPARGEVPQGLVSLLDDVDHHQ